MNRMFSVVITILSATVLGVICYSKWDSITDYYHSRFGRGEEPSDQGGAPETTPTPARDVARSRPAGNANNTSTSSDPPKKGFQPGKKQTAVQPFTYKEVELTVLKGRTQNGAGLYEKVKTIVVTVPAKVILDGPEYLQRMTATKEKIWSKYPHSIPVKVRHPSKKELLDV
ncbi:MAG: hypothetical protein FWH21_02100 [Kiritimatiellaeota bacterium]|nr:hypothetical protein [Kiritimatiellota bacterium]